MNKSIDTSLREEIANILQKFYETKSTGSLSIDYEYSFAKDIEALLTKKVEEARVDELSRFGYASFKFVIPEDGLRYDHIDPYIFNRIAELTANATPQEKNGANQ